MPIDFERLSSLIAEQESREYSFAHTQEHIELYEIGASVDWHALLHEHAQVSFKYLEKLFQLFKDKKINEEQLIGSLKLFLALHDVTTQTSDLDCTYIHGAPISVVCLAIAEAIAEPNEAVAQVLMPTVIYSVNDAFIQGLKKSSGEVTIAADSTQQRHFHLHEYLRTAPTLIYSILDVFVFAMENPGFVAEIEKNIDHLNARDNSWLRDCLGEVSQKYYDSLCLRDSRAHNLSTFDYHLQRFIQALYGSPKISIDTTLKANLAIAKPAILNFYRVCTTLTEDDYNEIAGLTLKGFEMRMPATFEQLFLAVLVEADLPEIKLTEAQMLKLDTKVSLGCTHRIAMFFSKFLEQYPWLNLIMTTETERDPNDGRGAELEKSSRESLDAVIDALKILGRKDVRADTKNNFHYFLLHGFYKAFTRLLADQAFLLGSDEEKATQLSQSIATWDELLLVSCLRDWHHTVISQQVFDTAIKEFLIRSDPIHWHEFFSNLGRGILPLSTWINVLRPLASNGIGVIFEQESLEAEVAELMKAVPSPMQNDYIELLNLFNIQFSDISHLTKCLSHMDAARCETYLSSYNIDSLRKSIRNTVELSTVIRTVYIAKSGLGRNAIYNQEGNAESIHLGELYKRIRQFFSRLGYDYIYSLIKTKYDVPNILACLPGHNSTKLKFLRDLPGYPDKIVKTAGSLSEVYQALVCSGSEAPFSVSDDFLHDLGGRYLHRLIRTAGDLAEVYQALIRYDIKDPYSVSNQIFACFTEEYLHRLVTTSADVVNIMRCLPNSRQKLNFLRCHVGYPDIVIDSIEDWFSIYNELQLSNSDDNKSVCDEFVSEYDITFYQQHIKSFPDLEDTTKILHKHGRDIKVFIEELGGMTFLAGLSEQPDMQYYDDMGLDELSHNVVQAWSQSRFESSQGEYVFSLEEISYVLQHLQRFPDNILGHLQSPLTLHLNQLVQDENISIILIDLCCNAKLDPNIVDVHSEPLLHLLLKKLTISLDEFRETKSRYYHLRRFLCFSGVDIGKQYGEHTAHSIASKQFGYMYDGSILNNLLNSENDHQTSLNNLSGFERLCAYSLYDLVLIQWRAEHCLDEKIRMSEFFVKVLYQIPRIVREDFLRPALLESGTSLKQAKLQLAEDPTNAISAVKVLLLCDDYREASKFLRSTRGEERTSICALISSYFKERACDNVVFGELKESDEFESEKQDVLAEIEKILVKDKIIEVIVEEPDEDNETDAELVAVDIIGDEGTITQTSQTVPSEATGSGTQADSSCGAIASSSAQVDSSRKAAVEAMVERGDSAIHAGHHEDGSPSASIHRDEDGKSSGPRLSNSRPST